MNDNLTDRQIVRLHRMKADGMPTARIAEALGVSPQSVYNHLSFRVSYTHEVYQKIGYSPKLPTTKLLTIHEAAVYLPGWPSRDKTYRLWQAGILQGKIELQGRPEYQRRRIVCTQSQVKQCAKRMLPASGIFMSYRTLNWLAPEILQRLPKKSGRRLDYWPARLHIFYPMPLISQVAIDSGLCISVPAAFIRRAITALDICGVATV